MEATLCACGQCWWCTRPVPAPVPCLFCKREFTPDHSRGDYFCGSQCRENACRAWREGRTYTTEKERQRLDRRGP